MSIIWNRRATALIQVQCFASLPNDRKWSLVHRNTPCAGRRCLLRPGDNEKQCQITPTQQVNIKGMVRMWQNGEHGTRHTCTRTRLKPARSTPHSGVDVETPAALTQPDHQGADDDDDRAQGVAQHMQEHALHVHLCRWPCRRSAHVKQLYTSINLAHNSNNEPARTELLPSTT